MVNPAILQVVGYQNSGKTTFAIKLIQKLKCHGLKTVTIKHHGHGGKPVGAENKDSTRHLTSGAIASIVEGEGRMILQADNWPSSLENQIELMKFFRPDVILIEGHKQRDFPKLLFLREKSDLSILSQVDNVKGIVYWQKELKDYIAEQMNVPSFHIHDEAAIKWTVQLLENIVHKIDRKT